MKSPLDGRFVSNGSVLILFWATVECHPNLTQVSSKVKTGFAHFLAIFHISDTFQQRSDSLVSADSELAQCETEVNTLLKIISDLNRKMDSLQIPR